MAKTANLMVPEPFKELYQPSKQWRHIIYHGGRSSGKSTGAGLSRLVLGANKKLRGLCTREYQNSMSESVHQLLSDLIKKYDFLGSWEVQKEIIYNRSTGSEIYFKGLHNNSQTIKSFEGVDWCWVEEAQSVSAESIQTLIPTIRKPGSQILWTFNRLTEYDPVWDLVANVSDDRTYLRKVNSDEIEALLSEEIIAEREKMRKNNPEMFKHVWLGEPMANETGSVFGKQLAQAREDGRICSVPVDGSVGVYTVWDLGVGDSTAIWFLQKIGREMHFVDYYENSGEDASHYISVIRAKGYNYATHFLPHDATHREFQTGLTRTEFFAKNGINNVEVLRPTKFTVGEDDINMIARPRFSLCWFDEEKCKRGLECLRAYHYEYDKKNCLLRSKPEHDWSSHGSSAFIYAMIADLEKIDSSVNMQIKTFTPKEFQ